MYYAFRQYFHITVYLLTNPEDNMENKKLRKLHYKVNANKSPVEISFAPTVPSKAVCTHDKRVSPAQARPALPARVLCFPVPPSPVGTAASRCFPVVVAGLCDAVPARSPVSSPVCFTVFFLPGQKHFGFPPL